MIYQFNSSINNIIDRYRGGLFSYIVDDMRENQQIYNIFKIIMCMTLFQLDLLSILWMLIISPHIVCAINSICKNIYFNIDKDIENYRIYNHEITISIINRELKWQSYILDAYQSIFVLNFIYYAFIIIVHGISNSITFNILLIVNIWNMMILLKYYLETYLIIDNQNSRIEHLKIQIDIEDCHEQREEMRQLIKQQWREYVYNHDNDDDIQDDDIQDDKQTQDHKNNNESDFILNNDN